MRIVLINSLYYPYSVGGAERSTQILAESLSKRGHDVFVICLCESDAQVKVINGVTVYYIKISNIYWPFDAQKRPATARLVWHFVNQISPVPLWRVRELVKELKADVIHTNNITGFSSLLFQLAKNYPIVHTLRDFSLMCINGLMLKRNCVCEKQCGICSKSTNLAKFLSNKVHVLVGISNDIAGIHVSTGFFNSAERFRIFNSAPELDGVAREGRRDSQESLIRLGYIGRIDESKGVENLIKAFVATNRNDLILKIAGSGDDSYIKYLKNRYPQSNIIWVGRSNNEEFYAGVDCVVVPSIWREPLSRVVIECIALNIPLICAKAGGIPEAAAFGNVVNFYSPESVEELHIILNNLQYLRIREAIQVDLSPFKPDVIAEQYEESYLKAIDKFKNQREI